MLIHTVDSTWVHLFSNFLHKFVSSRRVRACVTDRLILSSPGMFTVLSSQVMFMNDNCHIENITISTHIIHDTHKTCIVNNNIPDIVHCAC